MARRAVPAEWRDRIIDMTDEDPATLVANPENFRRHPDKQRNVYDAVADDVGFTTPVLRNRNTGHLVDGHMRVEQAVARGVRRIKVVNLDLTPEQEATALASHDAIGAMADEDSALKAALIRRIAPTGTSVLASYFRAELDRLDHERNRDAAVAERADLRGRVPNPRRMPLDAIYTFDPTDASCAVAHDAGFLIGTHSEHTRLGEEHAHKWSWRFRLGFIDNDFKEYDHGRHLNIVARHRPKYTTVRDLMTPHQCDEAGIPFYPFDTIMAWAEELQRYADHVIVIPKYDCIAGIPPHYVLGYSVPTSYGGTPLTADRFAGRPVHLLGGSWRSQLAYLAALGDDVVSLDFNHINNIAQWGGYVYPDGSREAGRLIQSLGLSVTNARQVALAISLGHIGRALWDMRAGDRYKPDDSADRAVADATPAESKEIETDG